MPPRHISMLWCCSLSNDQIGNRVLGPWGLGYCGTVYTERAMIWAVVVGLAVLATVTAGGIDVGLEPRLTSLSPGSLPGPQWQQLQYDAQHSGRSRLPGPTQPPILQWENGQAVTSDFSDSLPAVGANGLIFVGICFAPQHAGACISALSAASGEVVWTFVMVANSSEASYVSSSPALSADGSLVYTGPDSGTVFALNSSTGTPVWSHNLESQTEAGNQYTSSATVGGNGVVYVGLASGYVAALSGTAGTLLWRYRTAGPVDGSVAVSPSGLAFVGSDDGCLYALDAASGALQWKFQTGDRVRGSPAVSLTGNGTDIAAVFVVSDDGVLYCVDSIGALVWKTNSSGLPGLGSFGVGVSLGADGATVFAGVTAGKGQTAVAAFDIESGDLKWTTALNGPVGYPVLDSAGTVFVGTGSLEPDDDDSSGRLLALNGSSGEVLWSLSTSATVEGVVVGPNRALYTVGAGGRLSALIVPSPSPSPSVSPSPSPSAGPPSPSPSPSPSSLPPMYVGTNGTTDPGCGTTQAHPCSSLSYAINSIANALQPLTSAVTILLAGGRYGPTSCGGVATRPIHVVGAGSSDVTVDCAGSGRLLLTNDSLVVVGVTVTRGNASVIYVESVRDDDDSSSPPNDDFLPGPAPVVGGGGGIAVQWPPNATHKVAEFYDVVWLANTATVTVAGQGSVAVLFGGGGLSVTGGGSGCVITVQECAAGVCFL